MRLGIIGLPLAGKTTIFNALTGGNLAIGASAGRLQVSHGVAAVPDSRLEALSATYRPRKTTPIQLELGDISGLTERGAVSGELANELATWEGLLLVLRGFDSPLIEDPPDPQRDLALVEAELLLSDLLRVESRLERVAEERQKGARERAELEREQALFERLASGLRQQQPLRSQSWEAAEREALQGFGLLTLKPLLAVQNLAEEHTPPPLQTELPNLPFYGKLEHELAQLPEGEARAFRDEFGVQESGPQQLLQAALSAMGRISFFTVSERELRAWPLRSGAVALEAAGTIHSDMQRGFIRAEVIQWDRLLGLGGFAEARQAGQLPSEGREHPISDGDVVHVRFNV